MELSPSASGSATGGSLPEDQRDESGAARVHPLPATSDTDYSNALDEGADAVQKRGASLAKRIFFGLGFH